MFLKESCRSRSKNKISSNVKNNARICKVKWLEFKCKNETSKSKWLELYNDNQM